jgi:hypothetical protein
MPGERGPDVRLFHLGGNIEVLVIPQHLHARAKARPRLSVAFNIDKVVRPASSGPCRIIKTAIDLDNAFGARAIVTLGLCSDAEPGCGQNPEQEKSHD